MPKITMIGAGSTVFMKNLIGDMLLKPALAGAEVVLQDIDDERLAQSTLVAKKLIASLGVPARLVSTTHQREAVRGADYVIVAFQIGGYRPCTVTDFAIPKRYGLNQTIADTLGIGGIFRGLRTVPRLLALARDMAELAPGALLLNYVNPMAINTRALTRLVPEVRQVGLCHSVQNTLAELCADLEINPASVRYRVAGINHLAFFLNLEGRQGDDWVDLYPRLRQVWQSGRAPRPGWNPRCENHVRYHFFDKVGYFPTESSEHFAEYVPWYIKPGRDDLIERFRIPLDEYPKRCEEQIAAWTNQYRELQQAERIDHEASNEYAATIINAEVTGESACIYGNVANHGLIENLPAGCAVEVPCLVDANGVQPTAIGRLPPQLAAVMQSNVTVQELVVEAIALEDRRLIYHAAMMDPQCAVHLDLDQIYALVDELIEAHGEWLPAWCRDGK
ncbi:unnamed protein product [Cyprideis torosa]|uniref:Uncharacterized protein n=1 Tax=Cyprideis torosa TaxID=163714 RepID=A0A7R8WMZ4_9CRUS|nr:unnamed protein product [Cyprideis torosa]CAG0905733.1 unnamed protein product [Cyprideis torosa]